GSGLGLFIVREIVVRSGGHVYIEDRVTGDWRQGSRFVVRLPLVKHKSAAPLDVDAMLELQVVPPPIEVPIIEVGRRPGELRVSDERDP
ncbi:MAG: HAMP domain-containing histidine kinase, partial [Thermoplasmata archaeon]|nr:HAMP domain-containing histidine kinase [Thermoplasmata archaeon]